MEKTFRTPSGLTLSAETFSSKKDADWVLFAHGGGQTRHAWKGSAKAIHEKGYNTCTLDLRGHGDSDWAADGDYAFEAFAQDLAFVSQSLSSPPILVGASLGGIAAMMAAGETAPGCFKALVLVDVTPNMNRDGIDKIVDFMSANLRDGFKSLEEAAESVSTYLPSRKAPENLEGLMKNLRVGENGRFFWHWDPQFIAGARQQSASHESGKLERAVEKITIPMALIRGKMSELVTEEEVARFLDIVPEAKYYNVADAGHMVAGDSNSVFNDALEDYLATLSSE